jgi:hypothetical protein
MTLALTNPATLIMATRPYSIGRFVANEIVAGRRNALLEPFGLARFSRATAARDSTISPLVEIRDMDGRRY